MNARSFAVVLTVAAALLVPEHAPAQPATPGAPLSAEAVKRADALYKQGVRLYSAKKWAEAEVAFRSAWELNPTFDVAYNLGSAQYQLGKCRDAAEHFSLAVHNWPLLNATAALRKTAQQRLDECRAQVGVLSVNVNVERAEVFVDGKRVGKSPLPPELFVAPGEHMVEAKLEGYDAAQSLTRVAKGTTRPVTLTLTRVAGPPPTSHTAEPVATAVPSASGVPVAPTASSTSTAPPVPVPDGPNPAVIIAGSATAGVALIFGIAFAAAAKGKAGSAADQRAAILKSGGATACTEPFSGSCQELQSTMKTQATFGNVATWSFIAAGALGASTVIYALAAPRAAKKSGVRLAPVVAAEGGGVVLRGEW